MQRLRDIIQQRRWTIVEVKGSLDQRRGQAREEMMRLSLPHTSRPRLTKKTELKKWTRFLSQ